MDRFASVIMRDFLDPKKVSKILNNLDKKSEAMLVGILGSIEKGGKTVQSSEEDVGMATRFLNLLSGKEKGGFKENDFRKISELVQKFIEGPSKRKDKSDE